MSRRSLVLIPLFTLAMVQHGFAQDGPVSGQEIQQGWVGKELTGTTGAGTKVFLNLTQTAMPLYLRVIRTTPALGARPRVVTAPPGEPSGQARSAASR